MGNDVFRFFVVRPPQRHQSDSTTQPSIRIRQPEAARSRFHEHLNNLVGYPDARSHMRQRAQGELSRVPRRLVGLSQAASAAGSSRAA